MDFKEYERKKWLYVSFAQSIQLRWKKANQVWKHLLYGYCPDPKVKEARLSAPLKVKTANYSELDSSFVTPAELWNQENFKLCNVDYVIDSDSEYRDSVLSR